VSSISADDLSGEEAPIPVGAPGGRTRPGSSGRVATVAAWLFLAGVTIYFVFPFLAIARFSLQRVPTALLGANNLFDRWTFEGPLAAFRDPQFGTALRYTLMFTVGAVVLTIGLMLPTAMWVHLRVPQARPLVETLTVLPYMIPPIALVVGVIGAYKETTPWFFNSRFVLIPFYAVLAMPFTYRALDAGLRAIDLRTLVDASRSLGAGWTTTIVRVLIPNMRVALLSSSFLTATVVVGEFTMASILGFSFPNRMTLPVFTQTLSLGSPFAGFSLGLMTLVASTILLAIITFVTGRRGAAAAARGI
jgi:putative spermidine/putrescine transport system permease protein